MKKCLLFLSLAAIFSVSSCSDREKILSDRDKSVIEQQVRQQWDSLLVTVSNADGEAYARRFSGTGLLSMISEGYRYTSGAEYADTVRAWFGARKSAEILEPRLTITVLAHDLAMLDQTGLFQATLKNDSVARIRHAATFLFKKEKNGWQIIHGHESWRPVW